MGERQLSRVSDRQTRKRGAEAFRLHCYGEPSDK